MCAPAPADAPRTPRASAGVIARAGLGAILPLLMPGTLLAGILLGIATPTEIAALAVVYGLLLSSAGLSRNEPAAALFALRSTPRP